MEIQLDDNYISHSTYDWSVEVVDDASFCAELLAVLEANVLATSHFKAVPVATHDEFEDITLPNVNYIVVREFRTPSLTSESLFAFCQPYLQAASRIRILEHFCSLCTNCTEPYGATTRAFALAIQDYIDKWREYVLSVANLGKATTVAAFHGYFCNRIIEIDYLFNLFLSGILPIPGNAWIHSSVEEEKDYTHAQRAAVLLNTLFAHLSKCPSNVAHLKLLLWLFIRTSRPYILMLEDWLHMARITSSECFFVNNPTIPVTSDLFWDSKYTVAPATEDIPLVPPFLAEVAPRILTAGKSVEIMRQIIDNAVFRRKYRIGEDSVKQLCQLQQTSLYDSIITQLATYFCSTKSSNDKQYNIEESIVSGEQRLSTLFGISRKDVKLIKPQDTDISDIDWDQVRVPDVTTPNNLLRTVVGPIIEQCDQAGKFAQQFLIRQCELLQHLRSARKFFMMELELPFAHFTKHVFSELTEGSKLSESELNFLLHKYVDAFGSEQDTFGSNLVSIKLHPGLGEHPDIITSMFEIQRIRMKYTVDWPAELFFDAHTTEQYNTLFSFLMQVTCSQFTLERLIIGQTSQKRNKLLNFHHRVHLLRNKLLHFAHNLRSFIVNRVIQSAWELFEEKFSSATDMADALEIHASYLQIILDRCFLNTSTLSIRAAMSRLLDMALLIPPLLQNEGALSDPASRNYQLATLTKLELEYSKNCQFLTTVLRAMTNQIKLPFVEELLIRLDFTGHFAHQVNSYE